MTEKHNPTLTEDLDNANLSEQTKPVVQVLLGQYYNLFTMQISPVTQGFIERESKALMDWSRLDDSLRIHDYTDMKGYPPQDYYTWVDNFPALKLAHEYAMRRIASRRELGALTRKYSEKAVSWTLGHYDKIYKEEIQYFIRLKEDLQKQQDIKVVIEQIPSLSSFTVESERETVTYKQTPEQVAARVTKSTKQVRKEGGGPYVAKSSVKKASKKLKEKYADL